MERWTNNTRVDGLTIQVGINGYVILPARGLPLDRCPCCDKGFPRNDTGLRGARLVADILYPTTEAVDAEEGP